jgi:hypothetical protein
MWNQVLKIRIREHETPIQLDFVFNSSALVVRAALDENAALPYGKRDYERVGKLSPIYEISPIGLVKGNKSEYLYLRTKLIRFQNPYNYSYKLELFIHLWTTQLDLTFWENDEPLIS